MKKSGVCLILVLSMILQLTTGFFNGTDGVSNEAKAATKTTKPSTNNWQEVYEAEDASYKGLSATDKRDDFTGSGYVEGFKKNSSLTFTVKSEQEREYGVYLRYTNGSKEAVKLGVLVNDTKVTTTNLSNTINGDTWKTALIALPLSSGTNKITFTYEEGSSYTDFAVDKISMSYLYQAENATLGGTLGVSSEHEDYSGSGFVSGFNNANDNLEFNVTAPHAGEYTLSIRYAAGQTNSIGRFNTLFVNSKNVERIGFNTLRDWKIWGIYTTKITLNEGANTIAIKRLSSDDGEVNIDCITLKPREWNYAGGIKSYSGNGTSSLTFKLSNAYLRMQSVSPTTLKVWLDEQGTFERKYESMAVTNEKVDPQKLTVQDLGDYYQFVNGNFTVQVGKNPLTITYLDAAGNIIQQSTEEALGFTADGELTINNVLSSGEAFWGLGEKYTNFNLARKRLAIWSNDAFGAHSSSAIPATFEDGRWYMAVPYFISSRGYSILFDNTSRAVFDFGKTDSNVLSYGSYVPNPGGELIYYFSYSNGDLKGLNNALSKMVGDSFFAPLTAYGNMQSHWGYKQSDVIDIVETYRDYDIPLDYIIVDLDWYEYLCMPADWNKRNFPDPEAMFKMLDNLHATLGMINDPNVNTTATEYFLFGKENGYFVRDDEGETKVVCWPWGGDSGLTDFFNPEAREWWGNYVKILEDMGVGFFWLDMNEPSTYNEDWMFYNIEGKAWGDFSEMKNAYAIMHQLCLYEALSEDNTRPILLTRSGSIGTQRYAAPWTGDINGDFGTMARQITLGISLGMSGYNYWTLDSGGFFQSVSNEQYARWVEFSSFLPLMRFHYCIGVEAKEPWTHDATDISKYYIGQRYQLIPYYYSLSADSIIGTGFESDVYGEGGSGIPLTRSMVLEYPSDTKTYNMDSQFMCGTSLLVAPVTESANTKDVYLPEGTWYDYSDGKTIYSGGQTLNYYAPVDQIPVFAKAGSIIPKWDSMEYVGEHPISNLYLDIYPLLQDGNYEFVYYEDDNETLDYQNGIYSTTAYTGTTLNSDSNTTFTFDIGKRTGSYTNINERDYTLQFHLNSFKDLSITMDGNTLTGYANKDELMKAVNGWYVDQNGICNVKFNDDALAHTVVITGTKKAENEYSDLISVKHASVDGKAVSTENVTLSSGQTVDFVNVYNASKGTFPVYLSVSTENPVNVSISVNGSEPKEVTLNTGSKDATELFPVLMTLRKGSNNISITANGSFTLDGIQVDNIMFTEPVSEVGTYQAEDGILTSVNYATDHVGYTGTGFAAGFESTGNSVVLENINVNADGTYPVSIRYANNTGSTMTLSIYTTNESDSKQISFPDTGSWDTWGELIVNMELTAGSNTITLIRKSTDTGRLNIDSLFVPPVADNITNVEMSNNSFELGSADDWTVSADTTATGWGVDTQDAYIGKYKFYFFNGDSDTKQTLSRTINNLEDGTYMVTAWAKVYNTKPNECYLSLGEQQFDIEYTGAWEYLTFEVEVVGGELKIAFYFDAPAFSSMQIDEVCLYKVDRSSSRALLSQLNNAITAAKAKERAELDIESWNKLQLNIQYGQQLIEVNSLDTNKIIATIEALGATFDPNFKLQSSDETITVGNEDVSDESSQDAFAETTDGQVGTDKSKNSNSRIVVIITIVVVVVVMISCIVVVAFMISKKRKLNKK